ncbi:MAG: WG repeat-containing protein [Fusobacteriaceae bacterium]
MKLKFKLIFFVIIVIGFYYYFKETKKKLPIENYHSIFKEYLIKIDDTNIVFENQYKGKNYNFKKSEFSELEFNKSNFGNIIYFDDEKIIILKDTLSVISKNQIKKTKFEFVKLLDDKLIVSYQGKYGLLDMKLNVKVPPIYTRLSGEENSNILLGQLEDKVGYLNKTNEIIVPFEYENGATEKLDMMIVMKDKKIGVIDLKENIILELKYEEIYYNDKENFIVKENEDYYSVSVKEKTKEKIDATWIGVVKEDIAFYEKDGKFGLIKLTGEKITENLYSEFPVNYKDVIIGKLKDKYGLINQLGEKRGEFKYDYILPLGNYIFEAGIDKKDKILLIDNNGKFLIEENYEDITELNKTYLILTRDNKKILFNKNNITYKEVEEVIATNSQLFVYKKDNKIYVKKINK